jgi:hypothetical protein
VTAAGEARSGWRAAAPVDQPGRVRARWLLGLWSTLALVVGLTVVVDDALDLGRPTEDPAVGADPASTATTATPPAEALRPDQARVSGTVSTVRLGAAALEPRAIGLPLVIEADRGFGNGARIDGAVIDGRPSTIEWDAGRPLALDGDGALELDEVDVALAGDGLRLALGARTHRLPEGSYRLDAPVAVGSVGLTTPRDVVSFTTTRGGAALVARGDAAVVLRDVTALFLGPGSVELGGDLTVTTAAGTRPATSLRMAEGRFEVTLRPGPDGTWQVEAILQGAVSLDGDEAGDEAGDDGAQAADDGGPGEATDGSTASGSGTPRRLPEAHRSRTP